MSSFLTFVSILLLWIYAYDAHKQIDRLEDELEEMRKLTRWIV